MLGDTTTPSAARIAAKRWETIESIEADMDVAHLDAILGDAKESAVADTHTGVVTDRTTAGFPIVRTAAKRWKTIARIESAES